MNIFVMTTPWYEILLRTFIVYMVVLVAEQQVEDRAADERADDAEDDRAEPAHRVRPGHDPARDRAGDETD